ncbi:MAG TPA: adenylate/guanylate cyclase domain-containing protein [Jatrophihabitantaceae bacterium]|nr:adenylate/guanylate cyclase domain-containing protein [Jatrophihabitantaceae bacterium]
MGGPVGPAIGPQPTAEEPARPRLAQAPASTAALAPYVPRLVADWLGDMPTERHRSLPGSLVFADITGFTALTERLAIRGRAGAEEMGDLVNAVFDELLTAAYNYGANLLKWGGDAVLLLFDGDGHGPRAARAAWAMQQVLRRAGRLSTSCGPVRLRMTIGVHTGVVDFLLVGQQYRELIVAGPAASTSARMERLAQVGEVVLSPSAAELLPPRCLGESRGEGVALARAPVVPLQPIRSAKRTDVDFGQAMSPLLRDHLLEGRVEHEHRSATIGFVNFTGTDDLLAAEGPGALTAAVAKVVETVEAAAAAHGVAILSTDVAENGGKIILTAGVPIATGDDETRVLSTLRVAVDVNVPLQVRAGVTCGAVFAGDYGPFYRRTYSIAGDAVNLAARLMGKAGPGQIVATPTVIARSRTPFATTALDPFQVKGKRAPITAVLVGDIRRESDHSAVERSPLIGRDAELAQLTEASARAGAGRGNVVEIVGPPGMGKSRLVDELTDSTEARVLWADGDIYGRATPYQPLQQMLRSALELDDDVGDERLGAVVSDFVTGSAPDLLPWLPLIAIAAGIDVPSTPEVDRLDAEVRRDWLESVTSDLLGRLLTGAHIFVFNDVQFMDDATIGLIRRLAADIRNRPWLMIVTRRPDTDPPVPIGDHVSSIVLTPLAGAAADELILQTTDDIPLPPHRIRQLVERAGGNPLFLQQLLAGARAGADLDELPDSIEGVIAAGIDRLPPRRRRWLRAAAVLGMTVDPPVLAALLEGTDIADETEDGLEEFIVRSGDAQLRFAHHLIRLTAYEGLAFRRRTELHAKAAEVLERTLDDRVAQHAALLSLHCVQGERYAQAWYYARLAGDQARESYAPAEASECYRRAVRAAEELDAVPDSDVADVLEAFAEVSLDLGDVGAAERALRHARTRARSDPHRLARLRLKTARQRHHLGRHADALRWVSRGRALLRDAAKPDDVRLLAQLAELGAQVRYNQGAYRTATTWARRAVDEARRAGDAVTEARGLGVQSLLAALSGQPWDEARVQGTLALYERIGDQRGKARASNIFGMCAYFAGRWDTALDYYAEAEQASKRIGRDHDAAAAAANRAEILIQQGRIDEAEPVLAAAIRVLVAAQASSFLGFAVSLYGRIALEQSNFDAAMDRFGEARELALEMGEVDESITSDALAADCLLRAGAPEQALSLADRTIRRAAQLVDGASAEPLLLRVRGEALLALREVDDGLAAVRASAHVARERGARHELQSALAALLRLDQDAPEVERAGWRTEEESLVRQLGIVSR